MIDNKAFYKLSYGLYVVSSFSGDRKNAQIANTVFQISSEPAMIAVSINRQHLTHEYIEDSRKIGISVLSDDTPMDFIGKFGFKSGRDTDKFSGTAFKTLESGLPIVLDNAISCFELEVEQETEVYTHTIYICRVKNAEVLKDADALTYKHYQDIKLGRVSKAPASKSENMTGAAKGGRYQCSVCGYIYDPEAGDPDSGIPAGTLFEGLPEDWICPICGVAKDMFEKIPEPLENKTIENISDGKKGGRYQCSVCGYIYDPKAGDPDSGIPAGTLFEDLPEDWTCPICGVTKDMFEKIM